MSVLAMGREDVGDQHHASKEDPWYQDQELMDASFVGEIMLGDHVLCIQTVIPLLVLLEIVVDFFTPPSHS